MPRGREASEGQCFVHEPAAQSLILPTYPHTLSWHQSENLDIDVKRQKCASLASRGSRYHSLYTCTGRSIPIWLCHDTGISGNEPSNCSKCASGPNVSQIRFTSHTLSRLHSCFSKD
jgi:hypothetical protein